ncbi:MAG TPA: serine/threonine-protein kinase [Polyangiaceae bacterium]|nr:serine/threonine-protein kinase [Polyangiaceae bacterium]
MLNKGDKIAHYTIESMLGSGGMGAVYLAVDGRLHRRVALKVILDSDRPEEAQESAARLLREARAAASLTHPNIVGVFDVGEHEGRVYLAMEYVVGKTLRDLMRDGKHPWQRRLRWLVDVARALGTAHREGLVHRDIKPENVMVRDDGIVKVLDFGIARRTAAPVDPTGKTESAHVATLTGKGLVVGTPMYMAPEQLKGGAPDPRTDQFSWGVMTYEVLAGERPWPEKSDLLAAVATILTEDPQSLRKIAPELPPAVESTVARTLARNPDQRFESMDDVADALDPLAARSGPQHSGRAATRSAAMVRDAVTAGDDDEIVAPRRSSGRLPEDVPSREDKHPSTKRAMVTAKSPEHPLAPPPQAQSPRRRWPFLAGVVVALVSSGVYYKFRKPIIATPHLGSNTAPLPTSSAGVALSDNAEAVRAYREGVQQWRDGLLRRSRASLEKATSLDPSFAAAWLVLAMQDLRESPSRAQAPYQKAYLHRDRLDARDHALLDALDPLMRASVDMGEAEAGLLSATQKFPRDGVFQFMLGSVREARSEYEQALAAYRDAISLDPSFMPALRSKGDVLRWQGKVDDAKDAFGACIAKSAAAATCLEERILLERDLGECEAMEKDARAWQAVELEASQPSYYVAAALMAHGAPIQSVEVALQRQWDAMTKDDRTTGELEDRANLALAQGDFATAERATQDWEHAITKPEIMRHSGPMQLLANIAYETGDVAKAGRIADGFLRVVPAYTPDPLGRDPTIWANEFLVRTGKLREEDLEPKRQDWIKSQEAGRTQDENRRLAAFHWATLYAGFAESIDEAKRALDKLPEFLPMPPDSRRTAVFNADLGKVYALAGGRDNAELAIGPLTAVTQSCIELDSPLLQTRAFYFLGMALENKGDLEGARKAYQVVLDRWGTAKPKSTTLEKARARLKALPE